MDPIEKAEHTMFFNGIYLSCSLKLGSHLEFSIPVLGSFKHRFYRQMKIWGVLAMNACMLQNQGQLPGPGLKAGTF